MARTTCVARPADATDALPSVLVIHENRGSLRVFLDDESQASQGSQAEEQREAQQREAQQREAHQREDHQREALTAFVRTRRWLWSLWF